MRTRKQPRNDKEGVAAPRAVETAHAGPSQAQLAASIAEIPRHVRDLEELFEKFEVDPQIARDLGDALKLAMLDAQALAANTAEQLTSSSASEPCDTIDGPDWELLRGLAEALTQAPRGDGERR